MIFRGGTVQAILVSVVAVAVGASLALNPEAGFILTLVGLGTLALAAPAGIWAIAAIVAALTFRGLVTLGVLPGLATFVDIPLAWGALAAALARGPVKSTASRSILRGIGALAVVALVSWLLHPSEPVRPLLYIALLMEPFALLAALVLDPPSKAVRRALIRTVAALVAIQVPLAFRQAVTLGFSDTVQGTLFGAGAGAHTISAVAAVGAIWLLFRHPLKRLWHLVPVAFLMAIPLLADAKQVIFALPFALVAIRLRVRQSEYIRRAVAILGTFLVLLAILPARTTAIRFIERAIGGQGGKPAVASLIWKEISGDPASLLLGKGPAQTVSRSAFMTTDLLLRQDSPLRIFRLRPASLALLAQARAKQVSGGGTSFDSGISSALGVMGDLGLVGAGVYGALLLWLFLALRRHPSAEGQAAAVGWVMFAILGLVFDWWEQPAFSVFLACLSGLALTAPVGRTPTAPVRLQAETSR
jgi:hypothetical protein